MNNPTKTVRVSAGTRIYYIDAHKDTKGQPYLTISEVPVDRSPGPKKRQRIFVHAEDIDKLAAAFTEVSNHIKNESDR